MRYSEERIQATIRDVRMQWRRRTLLTGGIWLIAFLVAVAVGLMFLDRFIGASPSILLAWCALGGLGALVVALLFIVRPLLRRPSDRQIALLIEEARPELEDRLISAVELNDPKARRQAHAELAERLIDDAAHRARSLAIGAVIDRQKEKVLVGAGALGLVFLLAAGLLSFDRLQLSLRGASLSGLVPVERPYMSVEPGSIEIEQGDSQDIVATLRDESDADAVISYRTANGEWRQGVMRRAVDEPAFLFEFVDVQDPLSYFVEHEGHRSDVYEISLYTYPAVERIDLTYTYPNYTGQPSRREEGAGDIHGLKGALVTVDVRANEVTKRAELVLSGGDRLELERSEAGTFRGHLRLQEPGTYQVLLHDDAGKSNRFPEEYRITPTDDERPYITIINPQRDVRANAIEEVLVTARVQDDFGVEAVRLRFAVNSGEEQEVSLMPAEARRTDVEGEHLFFLEDFALQPGDVISYYIEAEDAFHESPEMTDMYFIEVMPFDQEYRQVSAMGGMGGGPSATVLSQQEIIAATWKLFRERVEMSPDEYDTSRRALARAQENLRQSIDERLGRTAFSIELQQDENGRRVAEMLRQAVRAMSRAVDELEKDRLREALGPEREALNFLLRVEALNQERRIALNRGGSPGGGGSATEERMTELMDLELDISKDKYEMLPESSQRRGGGEADESLQKLRELARRQQNLANESRNRVTGEDRRRQVERLQREQNELRREAQALARRLEQSARAEGSSGEQSSESMERIMRNMQEAEEALRSGDAQRASARQQQALNELQRMAENYRRTARQGDRQQLEAMRRAFDDVRDNEARLERELERAAEGQTPPGAVREDLLKRRQAAREAMERIQDDAEALAGAGGREPELDAALRNLTQALRREAIDEQMQGSEEAIRRGWLDNARRRQEGIVQAIERLEEPMGRVSDQLPVTDEERLARALSDVRQLEEELQSLENEMRGRSDSRGDGDARADDADRNGDARVEGSSGDRASRADEARRRAQLDRIRDRLQQLRRNLGDVPALNNLDSAVSYAEHQGVSLVGEAAEAFFDERIFAPLSQLEGTLSAGLDQLAMERKLFGSRPADVPPEYRDIVERYYEALSKSAR